jgi:hypothetical protein
VIRSFSRLLLPAAVAALVFSCGKGNQPAPPPGADSLAVHDSTTAPPLPASIADTTSLSLLLRLKRGESIRFAQYTGSESSRDFNGMKGTGKEQSYFVFHITGQGYGPDGAVSLAMRYDSIRFTSEDPQGVTSFDSRDTATSHNKSFAQFTTLLDHDVVVHISPDGEVGEIIGLDTLAEIVLRQMIDRDSINDNVREVMRGRLRDVSIKPVLQNCFLRFPQHPVGIDSTWGFDFDTEMGPFPQSNRTSYTLKKFGSVAGRRTADVEMGLGGSIVKRKLDDSTATVALTNFSFDGSGSAVLDLDRGVLVSKSTRINVDLAYQVVGKGSYADRKSTMRRTMKLETIIQQF